jgi:hypothetical protein
MKSFRILAIVLLVVCFCSCHHVAAPPPVQKDYFPVRDYLESEIATIDSTPYKLVEYNIQNGKTDSALITAPEFNRLAGSFLVPDLDSTRFESRFEENSFMDQSTNLLSFTYSTKDTSYGLRRVDVLATPDPTGADRVKSIYLETSAFRADSLMLTKMYWNAGKSFSIIYISQPPHGEAVTRQTRVVWDSSE